MTPKEQYEERKAARKNLESMDYQLKQRTEQAMMLDTLDRFVTAVERIADAVESGLHVNHHNAYESRSGGGAAGGYR